MNFCIQYLSDPNETVAVRCFSMTVLARLAEQYPEIKNEVELAIHGAMKTPTAGMRVRAKRVLKQLEGLAD
jgi:hypothetical protein